MKGVYDIFRLLNINIQKGNERIDIRSINFCNEY